jgi:hypothetical protein
MNQTMMKKHTQQKIADELGEHKSIISRWHTKAGVEPTLAAMRAHQATINKRGKKKTYPLKGTFPGKITWEDQLREAQKRVWSSSKRVAAADKAGDIAQMAALAKRHREVVEAQTAVERAMEEAGKAAAELWTLDQMRAEILPYFRTIRAALDRVPIQERATVTPATRNALKGH